MKTYRYIVEIEMPDGDMVSANWLKDIIQQDCDSEDKDRQKVSVRELDLLQGLDVTDFCKPIPEEIAKVMPDVVSECLFGGEKEQPKESTIKGWVARDSVEDAFNGCGLILHHSKPWRTGGEWSNMTIAMHLPWSMFPDLRWEDGPIEVELTIHRV